MKCFSIGLICLVVLAFAQGYPVDQEMPETTAAAEMSEMTEMDPMPETTAAAEMADPIQEATEAAPADEPEAQEDDTRKSREVEEPMTTEMIMQDNKAQSSESAESSEEKGMMTEATMSNLEGEEEATTAAAA